MSGGNPWADPSTPTEQVPPYAGPPYAGPPASGPSYASGPYGYGTPYGWPQPYGWGAPAPWWPMPPQGPRRPGQVVGAAVLALVQAAMVLIGSLYTFMIAAMVGLASDQSLRVPGALGRVASEARLLAFVQLASVVLLVVAGVLALSNRPRPVTWPLLLVAFGVQVALAGYWTVRLATLVSDLPGDNSAGAFLSVTLFFAAPPLVGLGLVVVGPGRRWFAGPGAAALRHPGAG